ncbi:MAG TPA: transketolase C-terminal domain-containing protein [Acidocella sp.]|nr:transketolase C-terminal domain-containing protein [Acidocella sp.]
MTMQAMTIKALAMRDALLEGIWNEMRHDPNIFFTSADFGSPVLDKIRSDFPARFVNVGIAEQNLINVSAGLSLEGFTVFAYAIAPFITMRCYEQIRVNLALLAGARRLNVNLIGVGAGYSYVVSGPTHQCYEDITLMRALPNMQLFSPADHVSAGALLARCIAEGGPKYLRLDAQVLPVIYADGAPEMQRGFHVHRHGGRIAFVATGYMLHTAFAVAERLRQRGEAVGVIDLFDLARFDAAGLAACLSCYAGIVTMEEGFSGRGGMDALLREFAARHCPDARLLCLGVEPAYRFDLGTRLELHELVGIGPESTLRAIEALLATLGAPRSLDLEAETL